MPDRVHGGVHGDAPFEFSVNLNPLVSGSRVRKAVIRAAYRADRYPEQHAETLVSHIGAAHGVSGECIAAGNGSIELLYCLPSVLDFKRAWVLDPTFCEYRYICQLNGIPVEQVKPVRRFTWDLRALSSRLRKGDAVFLCNPNNPTASLFRREDIAALAESGANVIVDEAFMDFQESDESLIGIAAGSPNVIVIKSLTKIYSIPGLRIGFCVANRKLIGRVRALLPPWNVNGIAAGVAGEFLQDRELLERTRRFIDREKRFITRSLSSFTGRIRLYESAANFMLAESKDTPALMAHASRLGIALRDSGGFRGLGRDFFRFAIRRRSENLLLVEAVRSFFDGKRS